MHWRHVSRRSGAFLVLIMLMALLFTVGSTWLGPQMADSMTPEQASFAGIALLVVCAIDTLLLGVFILNARIGGWRLMLVTTLLYYGVKTFQANIEAAYFMVNLSPDLVPRLFGMTLPVALLWPPAAVWLLGKARQSEEWRTVPSSLPTMGWWTWVWKLALLGIVIYPLLFFGFGYFVAWRNADVRAFYGGGDLIGFMPHMRSMLAADPWVLPFEFCRGLLWAGLAALFLWSLCKRPWLAALLLALIFALVENNTHLFPNPLMPPAVRQVHFIETASSNFIFGLIAAGVLMWQPARRAYAPTKSAAARHDTPAAASPS